MPVVLIGIAFSTFLMFTNPLYNDVGTLRTEVASYNDALNNSKALENERDKLTLKYNTIDPDNLIKLQKLLPANVDNIRLILEIEKIASPYNMVLTDVKYNATAPSTPAPTTAEIQAGTVAKPTTSNYGTFDLEFSTSGSYTNFISFLKDIESNLRIVDISAIDFSSDTTPANTTTKNNTNTTISPEAYKYDFKIRTYYLKN